MANCSTVAHRAAGMTTVFLDRPLTPCWHCRHYSMMTVKGEALCSIRRGEIIGRPERGCDQWSQTLVLDEEQVHVATASRGFLIRDEPDALDDRDRAACDDKSPESDGK